MQEQNQEVPVSCQTGENTAAFIPQNDTIIYNI